MKGTHLCYHIQNLQSNQELHQGRSIFLLKIPLDLVQRGCCLGHHVTAQEEGVGALWLIVTLLSLLDVAVCGWVKLVYL